MISFVLGTRPEIIKLSPVIRECKRSGIPFSILHTGQHYSENLDGVFFEQLELPQPDYNLEVGSGTHGTQTGEMIIGIEEILLEEQPDVVLVQGDTNSVLAGAIAADKLECELGHVEAGLRSFDRDMPEESNRIVADHLADYLFAPTETSAELLREEGRSEDRIFVTGNTVVDAVYEHTELATEKSTVLKDLRLVPEEYVLMTAHRAENVDVPERFASLLEGVSRTAAALDTTAVYPIHPRAKKSLDEHDLSVPDGIQVVEPLDYLDFLQLERNARLIMTDSGGVQEEACILGVPCVTMRNSTERPETVEVGANVLAGVGAEKILEGALEMVDRDGAWENPFGDGTAAGRILEQAGVATIPQTKRRIIDDPVSLNDD